MATGRCEISVAAAAQHSTTVAVAQPGDAFGEESAVLGEPRSVSARAIEDSELLVLDRQALAEVLLPDSEAAGEMRRLAQQRRAAFGLLARWSVNIGAAEQARTMAIYAPKGGTGRTTVTLNLAAQLARVHPGEVVVVDLSLPFNDAALMANLVPTSGIALLADASDHFEESLLSATLPHPAGFLVLPGVLRPEQAELINAELVERTAEVLRRSFRFVLYDLAPQLSSVVLAVLERVDQVLILATPELSSLKDLGEVRRIFQDVLEIPPSRVMVALNHRSPQRVIDRAAVERALGEVLTCEFLFEGAKLEEAGVRGEILSLSDPRGSMARATSQLAAALDQQVATASHAPRPGRKIFGIG
jgi:pilus assembly protein CpaE